MEDINFSADTDKNTNANKVYIVDASENKVILIIEIIVINQQLYYKYVEKVKHVIQKHGGKYIVNGGQISPFTYNNSYPDRVTVIEFENIEAIKECFSSPDYLKIIPLRENSTKTKVNIIEKF